jgi:hypothetical protein
VTAPAAYAPTRLPVLALAYGLMLALVWPRIVEVWQTGVFHDPDDAMRLVQLRALLHGQGWYDMTVYRLNPPDGVFMHWSRVVDAPLALLVLAFERFVAEPTAELLARLVFPMGLLAVLMLAVGRLTRLLVGPGGVTTAAFLVVLSGACFGQFQPGRIDHHAPQIVLLAFMLGCLVASLEAARAREAGIAAALAALSLAISLENLPFILALVAALVGAWIWHGDRLRRPMLWFAAGLAVALPVCYAATVAPSRWLIGASDALSAAQMLAALVGALMLAGLAQLSGRLLHPVYRCGAAVLAGAALIGLVGALYPMGLRDPFAGVDPLVREIWLSNVQEAWPLPRFWQENAAAALTYAAPLVAGVAGALVALWRQRTLAWGFVVVALLAGTAMSFWQIRVLTSVDPLALVGGAYVVASLRTRLAATRWRGLAPLCVLAMLPFTSIGWALVGPADSADPLRAAAKGRCFAPAAFQAFKTLTPGLMLAPIDAGSHILAATPLSVVSAPYHRNNAGNRLAIDILMASPEKAHELLREDGVAYVAICPGVTETATLAQRAPGGLAATLSNDQAPDWLREIPLNATPYRVFAVAP